MDIPKLKNTISEIKNAMGSLTTDWRQQRQETGE